MRAFAVRAHGEAPALLDLPVPDAENAFLIRVTCAGINPVDYKLLDRLTPQSRYPFVMGIDVAGVIERIPRGVSDLVPGERVFGMARTDGAYAEFTAIAPSVRTEPLARIPDSLTDEQAASLPIAGITALRALDLLEVDAGRRLVVIGAAGAVGGYAVQMARARGAHVIAVGRTGDDEMRRLGAHEVYDATSTAIVEGIRAAHPDGVDAVLDVVSGAEVIRRDAGLLASGGRLVSAVYAADETWFASLGITAHNIASISNPLSSPEGLERLARMVDEGTIAPRIRAIGTLEEAPRLLEMVRTGGVHGKVIIRP
jgi:NADPH:quinone reductase-like Zn-dependent oxidoreductase